MIKVINVVSSLGAGGVAMVLKNYYENLDKTVFQFDFIVHGEETGHFDRYFKSLGCNIFYVTPKKESLRMNYKEIDEVIRNGNYDVIHCHQNYSNTVPLFIGKKRGVKVRISHSHGNMPKSNFLSEFKKRVIRTIDSNLQTHRFACGYDAGKWLFGSNWRPSNDFSLNFTDIVMRNAIKLDNFLFDNKSRIETRKNLNLEGKKILLHIGRFSKEKNHEFLIKLMLDLKCDPNTILLLAGDGPLKQSIIDKIKKYELKNIRLLGVVDDIPSILNASDILLLPSLNEGFPVTLIEGQCSDINIIASTFVTRDIQITDNLEFISINDTDSWVKFIVSLNNGGYNVRKNNKTLMTNSRFSIEVEARKFSQWLIESTRRIDQ